MEQTTEPHGAVPPASAPHAPGDDGFFDSVRRTGLVRTESRWVGGVAGGVARRFGIDPLLVRGLLVVTVLLGGAGLVVYGLGWALLPEERDGRIHLQETLQGRFHAALLAALAVVVVGLNRGAGWDGWWSDDPGLHWIDGLLWLAATVAVVAVVVSAVGRRDRADRAVGASRTVAHPGYGAIPVTAPVGTPGGGWPAGGPVVPPPPVATASMAGATSAATASAATGAPPSGAGATAYGGPPASGAPGAPAVPTGPAGPGQGGGPGGPGGWSGAPAPRPPAPRRPRASGPGAAAVGAVVGLTLLALAALLLLDREGRLGDQPVLLTALGIGVVLTGLGIMVSGVRGRSSGTLGFLAIVGILVAVPLSVVTTGSLATFHDSRPVLADGGRMGVVDGSTWRPRTADEARQGVSVGFGDLRVDLTDVPLDGRTVDVPIDLGAGELRVVVPEDVAVTADVALTAGEVTWDVDGLAGSAGFSGGGSEPYQSDEAADGEPVDLALHITAGAGDVRIEEED